MLVLTLKVGEQICVPQLDVVLTVAKVRASKVLLGVTAPREIPVVRTERSPKTRKF